MTNYILYVKIMSIFISAIWLLQNEFLETEPFTG